MALTRSTLSQTARRRTLGEAQPKTLDDAIALYEEKNGTRRALVWLRDNADALSKPQRGTGSLRTWHEALWFGMALHFECTTGHWYLYHYSNRPNTREQFYKSAAYAMNTDPTTAHSWLNAIAAPSTPAARAAAIKSVAEKNLDGYVMENLRPRTLPIFPVYSGLAM